MVKDAEPRGTGSFPPVKEIEVDQESAVDRVKDLERRLDRLGQELDWRDDVMTSVFAGICMVSMSEGVISFANPNFEAMFGYAAGELIGRPPSVLNGGSEEESEQKAGEVFATIMRDGGWSGEILNRRKNGVEFWCRSHVTIVEHPEFGQVALGTHEEIGELKRTQERQRLMLRELDHRVKNNLATVLALASQTLRGATSLEAFGESFKGRIRTMATAHELLSERGWEGVDVAELIPALTGPLRGTGEERIILEGGSIVVPPEVASPLSMLVHELLTNAVKHGALHGEGPGAVSVTWSVTNLEAGGSRKFLLDWRESGLEGVSEPDERGQGSALIEQLASYSLQGELELDWRPEGLRCRVSFSPDVVL